ncbi:(deoxy)nucleoside triphosphate pyrophosphohydrolase [Novosphingobium sp. Gsoil 351]|uniref:(deoxy)nucleoside triphosphate pyrophosphohydrolase n=1 Tax=Novosphingobium sp. Gsoil 351 TaxID=2675225 RepID=UPI0012B45952|nr:(deoxy)nucleoside triphosphate pyrophosphohydrolase [Novosphingobium sp. Gsoil 351]QGN53709.1 NUDIX domain-containing protein [Novosphingobium sp. Gsoil 351]
MTRIPTAVEVVAVALIDRHGRVLLQKRRPGGRHGGLWEFPGGKIEGAESAKSALIREISEELAIEVEPAELFELGETAEPSLAGSLVPALVLKLYRCARWVGDPCCLDAQEIGWFTAEEAAMLAVPPLDQPFIERLAEFARAG